MRKRVRLSELAVACPGCGALPPAFVVNDVKGEFACGTCHASGDLFDWAMREYGITFPQALKALGRKAGMDVEPPN